MTEEKETIWRGCAVKLDGNLSDQQVYDLLFKPALHALWEDWKSNNYPRRGIVVTMSYQVREES